eukprot:5797662-Amphidinium_carterae.1
MAPIEPSAALLDPYAVLGIGSTATDADVTKAYKKLALRYHPDKNPSSQEAAEEAFKKIIDAYTVLHDPVQREAYDERQTQCRRLESTIAAGGRLGQSTDCDDNTNMSRRHADGIFQTCFGG